jgi:hypothetical protein
MTSKRRRPQNIKSGISQQQFKFILPNHTLQILQMKTTSNGRRPQNIKSEISQQQLIGSYSNFKLMLE